MLSLFSARSCAFVFGVCGHNQRKEFDHLLELHCWKRVSCSFCCNGGFKRIWCKVWVYDSSGMCRLGCSSILSVLRRCSQVRVLGYNLRRVVWGYCMMWGWKQRLADYLSVVTCGNEKVVNLEITLLSFWSEVLWEFSCQFCSLAVVFGVKWIDSQNLICVCC